MPEFLTFEQAKASDLVDVAGVCADSDQFASLLNKATRMLMTRGDFWGTVAKVTTCIYNSCLVWPREVGTVLAVNVNRRPVSVWNNWYSFTPLTRDDFCMGGFGFRDGTCFGNTAVENDGTSPVFNPIACGKNMYVRAYPSTQQDIGKTVTIFGVDSNGQEIRTQKADKTWQDGVTITLAIPFVSTPMQLREVSRIIKQETQGPVRYYQYDSDNDVLLDLVSHAPTETTPLYRRSKIHNSRRKCGSDCRLSQIDALAKLEFIPVKYDSDRVLISNLDALKDMILSIKYSEAGDKENSAKYELSSIHEMNLEASNRYPKTQTPVLINPFGSALPVWHGVGRII